MAIKKVLHIAGNMDLGGAETLLINLNRNIDADKLRFDYAVETSANGFYAPQVRRLGGNLYPFILRRAPFGVYWVNLFNLLKVIKNNGPYCALHVHYTYRNWFFLAAAYFCGVKKRISHAHTTEGLAQGGKTRFLNPIRRKLIHLFATDLFACSAQAGQDLYGKGAKFTIINNAIDCARFAYNPAVRQEQRKLLGLEGKFVLAHIGRMESYKNQTFLLDVFAKVYSQNKDAALLFVGGGTLLAQLKAKAKRLGITQSVHFLGARSDSSIFLQAADVFVFPSLFEGFGIAALEAQASGLPCILSTGVAPQAAVVNSKMLPLEAGADMWAKEVLALKDFERKDQSQQIKQAGYDIKAAALWLQNYYLK